MSRNPPSEQTLSKVRHSPVADQAYKVIRESITEGRFVPGVQLVEAHLASDLGISRGPVREALKQLRQEGLVVHFPHQGTFVRRLTSAEMINIYDVRVALESVAIRRLARRGEVPAELTALVEEMLAKVEAGQISELIGIGYAFHRALCASSDNPLLVEYFDLMSLQARLALEFDSLEYLRQSDPSDYVEAHAELLAVIERGDEHEARAALEHHVLDSLEYLRQSDPSDYVEALAEPLAAVIERGDQLEAWARPEQHALDGDGGLGDRLAENHWENRDGSGAPDDD